MYDGIAKANEIYVEGRTITEHLQNFTEEKEIIF